MLWSSGFPDVAEADFEARVIASGSEGLVRIGEPINAYPDFVGYWSDV